jgi:hypothetical protein
LIDDEEDEAATGKPTEEKNAAATGRKPKLATSDPLFQHIWKRAGKELKRSVFFVNPFPDSEDYELLPLQVYTTAADSVGKLNCYKKDNVRSQARKAYTSEWASSVSH